MPEDVFPSVWAPIHGLIGAKAFAVTAEIFEEMSRIQGKLGEIIRKHKGILLYEVGSEEWPYLEYIEHSNRMQADYQQYISERNGNRKGTIGMNDLSIVALAKTLGLPVVSMEKRKPTAAKSKKAIPDICDLESVKHLTFTELLRNERITI